MKIHYVLNLRHSILLFHINQNTLFFYRNKIVGKLIPDLIVDERVVVDTKVVENFTNSHISQILSYLNITGFEVGLLLNFKHSSLGIKRIAKFK